MVQEIGADLAAALGCNLGELSLNYLGVPVSYKRPAKADWMPLIKKVEKKRYGWKGKLLSMGGRLTLVNSVLSAIPMYYMSVYKLPSWVEERIDQIRRNFLWGRSTNIKGYNLMNWGEFAREKNLVG